MTADHSEIEVLVNAGLIETRIAVMEAGRLSDLRIDGPWQAPEETLVGGLFLGRATKVVKGVNGAFVEIATGVTGFLSARDAQSLASQDNEREHVPIDACISEGEAIVVQVRADAKGDKGPRLSADISLPGRYTVLAPHAADVIVSRRVSEPAERERLEDVFVKIREERKCDEGFIVRTAAQGIPEDALQREAERLVSAWDDIDERADRIDPPQRLDKPMSVCHRVLVDMVPPAAIRIVVDDRGAHRTLTQLAHEMYPDLDGKIELFDDGDVFERHDVEAQIDAALAPRLTLPSGGSIVIEPTEALVAIDVNSSGAAGAGSGPQNIALRTNLEAAEEIARQLRLRDLGGLIAVDFLRLHRQPDRARLLDALRQAMAKDPAAHKVGSLSPFGLVELTRRHQGEPLADRLTETTRAAPRQATLKSLAARTVRTVEREARSSAGGALMVHLSADLARWLEGPGKPALDRLNERLGGSLVLKTESDWPRDRVELTRAR